jgi:hypothetical protein
MILHVIFFCAGDGWNGDILYFTPGISVTLPSGSSGVEEVCLPSGVYSPYACGGSYPSETSWEVVGYGVSGGADASCSPSSGSFTISDLTVTQTPSETPTPVPSSSPTITSQPSSAYGTVVVWEGGTNSPVDGVSCTFTGLHPSQHTYYLMVQVYTTDFEGLYAYVDGIHAGSMTLSSFCNPGVSDGGVYYTCVLSHDVTGYVSAGSLVVRSTATSDVNCCSYNGYFFYVKYTLSIECTSVTVNLYDSQGTNYEIINNVCFDIW